MFDVFKIDIYGEPILLEAVQSLEAAMARVITLRESLPADYVVVSQITGKNIIHREWWDTTNLNGILLRFLVYRS